MSEWIKVSEKIPPLGKKVLVACGDEILISSRHIQHITINYKTDTEEDNERVGIWCLPQYYSQKAVTHWKEMPDLPSKTTYKLEVEKGIFVCDECSANVEEHWQACPFCCAKFIDNH